MLQYAVQKLSEKVCIQCVNPLLSVAISKLLEMIGRSTYILACSIATALDSVGGLL